LDPIDDEDAKRNDILLRFWKVQFLTANWLMFDKTNKPIEGFERKQEFTNSKLMTDDAENIPNGDESVLEKVQSINLVIQ
jgi:hypothetical protein